MSYTTDDKQPKIIEFKRLGYRLVLEISPDGLSCLCSYEPYPAGAPLKFEELQASLTQAKVVEGVIDDAVSTLLSAATSSIPLQALTLAEGVPMIPGEDGSIALDELSSQESEAVEEDEMATVDFRNVQKFLNVTSGQICGRIVPPTGGIPGRTVHGTLIPAQRGAELKPVLGQNVRLSEDGCSIVAESDGRVYCSGPEISVEDVFTVRGDVDFTVGNIDFSGFVEIGGDVLDGFSVRAAKGIKVKGNIGVCVIESDGDIVFCGMSGQGKGTIRCGGTVSANFVNDVTLECRGDVIIDSEIRNSVIKSLGSVRVNKGGLSGGECISLAGIEASSIGTVTSLRTHVVVGVHYRDMAEYTTLFNEMKQLIAAYNANKATADPKVFMKARTELADRLQDVRSRQYEECNPKVNFKKILYEGVSITIGQQSDETKEELKGPLSMIENTLEGGFRHLSLTDLSVNAREIERAFVQQHEFMLRRSREEAQ